MSRYYNDYLQHSDEDTLAHFGIPGMKWGVRKNRQSYGDNVRKLRRFQKERRKTTDITKLSDSDLNKLNNRIAAEDRYIDLNRHKSYKFIRDVVHQSGNKLAVATVSALGAVVVGKMMMNPSTSELFMKFITPKKK